MKIIDDNFLDQKTVVAMKKKYRFGHWPFFYPEIMLAPYWNDRRKKWNTFVIVGSKNTGKTTNIIRYCLKRAIANRHLGIGKFVVVRRTGKERLNYWHSSAANGKWWPNCSYKKGTVFWHDPDSKEVFIVAQIESISGSGIGRGIENVGFDTLVFDDFIGLQGENRISGFSKRLEPMISNYFRENIQTGLVILIGNNDRMDAEWLIENNFQIPALGGCFELKRNNKSLKTIMYVEGINTKQGIISTQLKKFDQGPLAWASETSLEYLYSNQCMVLDFNVIDLRRWRWPEKRVKKYQMAINNQYCVIENGFLLPSQTDYYRTGMTPMWICYEINQNLLDSKLPIYALTVTDKLKAIGTISEMSETIAEWLWDLFNHQKLGFTNPVIKETLLRSTAKWVTKKHITDF